MENTQDDSDLIYKCDMENHDSDEAYYIYSCNQCFTRICGECFPEDGACFKCKNEYFWSKGCDDINIRISKTLIFSNCKEHKEYQANLWCNKCSKIICSKCERTDHKTHEKIEIIENYILNDVKQMKDFSEKLKNEVSEIENYTKNLHEIKDKVEEYYIKRIEDLKTLEDDTLKYIDQVMKEKIKEAEKTTLGNLPEILEIIENRSKELTNRIEFVTSFEQKIIKDEEINNVLPLLDLTKYEKENEEFINSLNENLKIKKGSYNKVEISEKIKENEFNQHFIVNEKETGEIITIPGYKFNK